MFESDGGEFHVSAGGQSPTADGGHLLSVPDGGRHDPGEVSHAVLLELCSVAERHPAVHHARRVPDGQYTRVRADLDPRTLGRDVETATLVIRWYAGETPARPEFSFHYRDSTGFECGWFRELTSHVEGPEGYEERASTKDEYRHESISFASDHPVGLLWEVFDRLEERLDGG